MFDDWHDFLRLASACAAFVCLYLLGRRYSRGKGEWNTKTRDYWFAMVLWCITSVVLAVEGLIEDRPVEPRLIFYVLATAITLKGLLNKSSWGASV